MAGRKRVRSAAARGGLARERSSWLFSKVFKVGWSSADNQFCFESLTGLELRGLVQRYSVVLVGDTNISVLSTTST